MTNPDCFYWQDTNEDPPTRAGEYVGAWIDSNGTVSTLPLEYDPDSTTPWVWTYDGTQCTTPHAWCANLDAHKPPTRRGNQPVKPPDTTPDTTRVETTEHEVRVPVWAAAGLVILAVARALTWRRR